MKSIIKASLIPFLRVLEGALFVLCVVCVIAVAVGFLYGEYRLWFWDWQTALGIHLIVAYTIGVQWSYESRANWWWWPDA